MKNRIKSNSDALDLESCHHTKKFSHHSLHIQNTKGINAPMATNIGNIAGDSSLSYGSRVFGPLGFLLLKCNEIFQSRV